MSKKLFIAAVEKTDNPLAPIILSDSFDAVVKLGKLMTPMSDKACCQQMIDNMLKAFTDDDLNTDGGDPNFICALCLLLVTSLEHFGRNLTKGK